MKKKALMFDFGGTIDTNGIHWSEYFRDQYKKFGIKVHYKPFREAFIESDRILSDSKPSNISYKDTLKEQLRLQLKYLEEHGNIEAPLKTCTTDKMIDDCYAHVNGTISYVREILSSLQNDFKLALISNFYGNLNVVLTEFDLKNFFAAVVDSAVLGFSKPDLRVFEKALSILGESPGNSVMIGDSYERDIIPANELGCTTVWLDGRSWSRPADTSKADYIIHNFKELPVLVCKNFL